MATLWWVFRFSCDVHFWCTRSLKNTSLISLEIFLTECCTNLHRFSETTNYVMSFVICIIQKHKHSWNSRKRPPKMSSLGGRLWEFRPCLIKILPDWNKLVTAETCHMHQCQCNVMFMWKVNSGQRKPVLPLRNFCLLYYPGILQWLQHLIIQFSLYYLLVVAYWRLKTKENFKLLALKVVMVAYARWSLTRGSQYSDLAEKLFVFWKTGCWGDLVAYERWSRPEVWLYL